MTPLIFRVVALGLFAAAGTSVVRLALNDMRPAVYRCGDDTVRLPIGRRVRFEGCRLDRAELYVHDGRAHVRIGPHHTYSLMSTRVPARVLVQDGPYVDAVARRTRLGWRGWRGFHRRGWIEYDVEGFLLGYDDGNSAYQAFIVAPWPLYDRDANLSTCFLALLMLSLLARVQHRWTGKQPFVSF